MIKLTRLRASVLAGGMAFLLAAGGLALGQAGSTSGTVGKTDKSVSGGNQGAGASGPSHNAPAKKPNAETPPDRAAGPISVAGRWQWTADCRSGHYTAGFQITQGMSGEINGSLFSDALNGSISGHVTNGVISFTRTALFLTQHWTGQLAKGGTHIVNGSITGNENCTWEARKE